MTTPAQASGEGATGDRRVAGGAHTPGPWDYVSSTEHHGPYVTSEFGTTICDCYIMSEPSQWSTVNGGKSRPIHHLHEMADPNARLIAAAPEFATAAMDAWKAISWVINYDSEDKILADARAKLETVINKSGVFDFVAMRADIAANIAKAEGRRSPDTTSQNDGR